MKSSTLCAALIAASLFCAATPAAAQKANSGQRLTSDQIWDMIAVCVSVVQGKFDLNYAAALDANGLLPDDPEDEVKLRVEVPGMEAARGSFSNGDVLLGHPPGGPCLLIIHAKDRLKILDDVQYRLSYGGNTPNDRTRTPEYEEKFYFFSEYVVSTLSRKGADTVSVTVRLVEKK